MKIKEIFNCVKKIFKVLSFQDEKSQMREDIVNLESFSILDNREDIELRQGYTWIRAFVKMIGSRILIAILSCFKCFIYKIGGSWLFPALKIILVMSFIFFFVEWIVSFLYENIQAKLIQKYYHLILLSLLALFYSWYVNYVFEGYGRFLIIKLAIFLGATLFLWVSLSSIVKKQPVYQLEEAKFSSSILVAFFAISSIILKVKWELNFWGVFVSSLTISNTILILLIDQKVAECHKKAREIFLKQLLLYNPDYEELKKCCFYGGEKYKEKLLSTEKFLQLIKKREVYNINYKRRRLRSRRRK